jgi:hypothetical protein
LEEEGTWFTVKHVFRWARGKLAIPRLPLELLSCDARRFQVDFGEGNALMIWRNRNLELGNDDFAILR